MDVSYPMKAPAKYYQRFACILLLTILAASLPSISIGKSSDTALQLMDRIGQAAESLNYQGVFVYLRNGQIKAVQVIHKVDEYGEHERLVSLNGMPRELIRNNELVTCILPEDKAVLVDEHRYPDKAVVARSKSFHRDNGFSRRLPAKLKAMREHYQFSLGKPDRIAGRETRQVVIIPRDRYRYGYHLWIDSETGLLLKTVMTGDEGHILEQMMFTSLLLPAKIPDTELVPAVSGREFSWREGKPLSMDSDNHESKWKIGWLPAGFALVAQSRDLLPNSKMPVEHMVYSDGLSSVSIFIERVGHTQRGHLSGFSSMGAVNAYGTIQALHYLTLVGEVPHVTVEQMGKSIRYLSSNTD